MRATRFEAEDIIRAAASGAIPTPGDVLLRVEDGWIFGKLNVGDLDGEIDPDQIDTLPFTKITGVILASQVPEGVVTQHEAALSLLFTQLTDQIADDQVPASAVRQHIIDVLLALKEQFETLEWLIARAVDNRPRSPAEKLYMAENYG